MKKFNFSLALFLLLCLAFTACQKDAITETEPAAAENVAAAKKKPEEPVSVSVFATGLTNPRGLKFGPDGYLYVAEAGTGGIQSTVGIYPQIQVAPPFGPHRGSATGGRVSKTNMLGQRTTVTDQLPSSQDAMANASIMRRSDVAFMGNTLYVLQASAGCSHGVTNLPNGVFRINPDGSPTLIANLGTWLLANPGENTEDDFEPEGVWYSMITKGKHFYAVDANQGVLVQVDLNGKIEEVVDISATQGHIVPTVLAEHSNFYFGNLDVFPSPGSLVFTR